MTLQSLATEAAAHWNGAPLRLIRNRENAVFEMEIPNGRAALRLHREGYQDDAAIRSELWWCTALAAQGVEVPAALPSHNGASLVTLSTGRKASAITWVAGAALGEAGRPFDTPLQDLVDRHQSLGQLLARFHGTTDRLALPPEFTRPRWDIPGLVGDTPFWGRFWDHPVATPDQRAVLVSARAFLHDQLSDHLGKGGDFGPIHADVLRENVLVNDRSLSLIDFDDSGFGFRLYDLGTALFQSLFEPAYPDIRDALMAGYGTDNRQMVEVFILARTCASVGWTMPHLGLSDPVNARQIARACRWADRVMT